MPFNISSWIMRVMHTVMNNYLITSLKTLMAIDKNSWFTYSALPKQLPNKLDLNSTDVCCLLNAQMTLIGKTSQKLRESLIISLVYYFSARSCYVKQHFIWAKGSATVLQSAEQCPWCCREMQGVWPSCSMRLPPLSTCTQTSLSKLTYGAKLGFNQLWGLQCAP